LDGKLRNGFAAIVARDAGSSSAYVQHSSLLSYWGTIRIPVGETNIFE
jgi:hypothetical protein